LDDYLKTTRRRFLKTAAAIPVTAPLLIPRHVLAGKQAGWTFRTVLAERVADQHPKELMRVFV
jgi:hypothetical protein